MIDAITNQNSQNGIQLTGILGFQAQQPFISVLCPMMFLDAVCQFSENGLPIDQQAQRAFDPKHAEGFRDYMQEQPDEYVANSLMGVFDEEEFSFVVYTPQGSLKGTLAEISHQLTHGSIYPCNIAIPFGKKIDICDGQHRKWGASQRSQADPTQAVEVIPISLRPLRSDERLPKMQMMFASLNKGKSIPVSYKRMYELTDPFNSLIRLVLAASGTMQPLVCLVNPKNNLAKGDAALFTYTSYYDTTRIFIGGLLLDLDKEQLIDLSVRFWKALHRAFPRWGKVNEKLLTAKQVRESDTTTLAVVLSAFGHVGNYLYRRHTDSWEDLLVGLGEIDFSQANPDWHRVFLLPKQGKRGLTYQARKDTGTIKALSDYLIKKLVGSQ
jgi:DGQHR domain-containing protein